MPASTPFRAEALKLVEHHLPLLAARDFGKLKRLLHTDDDGMRGVRTLITSLNPRPGAEFAQTEANYVIPDVVVKKDPRHAGSRRSTKRRCPSCA